MHKRFKKAALATAIAGSLLAGTSAQATEVLGGDLSANIAAVSNYYFRGVSQTSDGAAVQGSVDLGGIAGSGFYVGTWASNVDFGDGTSYEIDFYGGWAPSLGEFDFDLGYIYYAYPDNPGDDFDYGEIYGSVAWKIVSAGMSYTANSDVDDGPFKKKDKYGWVGLDYEFENGWGIGGTVGHYWFDDDGATYGSGGDLVVNANLDYTDGTVYVSKDAGDYGAFNLTFVKTNIDDDNDGFGSGGSDKMKAWVGWSKGF